MRCLLGWLLAGNQFRLSHHAHCLQCQEQLSIIHERSWGILQEPVTNFGHHTHNVIGVDVPCVMLLLLMLPSCQSGDLIWAVSPKNFTVHKLQGILNVLINLTFVCHQLVILLPQCTGDVLTTKNCILTACEGENNLLRFGLNCITDLSPCLSVKL